jgi:hypothetical protein
MTDDSGTGLLAVWTDVAPEAEADFNEWYDKEHVPEIVSIPGVLSGRRYQTLEGGPKYLALYEMADEKVWSSPGFTKVRENPTQWSKKMLPAFRNTQIGVFRRAFAYGDRPGHDAEFVLTVRLNTTPERESEFNEWYNADHLPALCGVDGVYCARRYIAAEGNPKYLAVYDMRDGGIPRTPEWNTARNYGRTAQIRPYLLDLQGLVAKRIYPK